MRVVLLILLALLVGGGGFGGYWFGIKGEPIPGFESDADSEQAAAAPHSNLESAYSEMEPLSIPVMVEGRVTTLLTLVVSLEVTGSRGLQAVAANRPRLRDAMLEELHGLYALRFVRNSEDELPIVRRRLAKRAKAILDNKLRALHVQAIQGREVN